MKRRTLSERFAVKLAAYHAAKPAEARKARAAKRRRRKQEANAQLREVLRMSREALGYRKTNTRSEQNG